MFCLNHVKISQVLPRLRIRLNKLSGNSYLATRNYLDRKACTNQEETLNIGMTFMYPTPFPQTVSGHSRLESKGLNFLMQN